MNKKTFSTIIAWLVIFVSCSSPPSVSENLNTEKIDTPRIIHTYHIYVRDQFGNPLSNAKISYKINDKSPKSEQGVIKSNSDGLVILRYFPTNRLEWLGHQDYRTTVWDTVSKDGYVTNTGFSYSVYGSDSSPVSSIWGNDSIQVDYIELQLENPDDYVSKYAVIDRSFFGIRLGEHEEDLRKQCIDSSITVSEDRWSWQDPERPGKILSFFGALNGNPEIKETLVYIFNNQVYSIQLFLKENTIDKFISLKSSLYKKYGSDRLGGSFVDHSSYSTQINGHYISIDLRYDLMNSFISLNHPPLNNPIGDWKTTLTLGFTYNKMSAAGRERYEAIKTQQIERDL